MKTLKIINQPTIGESIRMQGKVIFILMALILSTTGSMFHTELIESVDPKSTSIGNMPKNIAEDGDTGKYTSIKIDGMNNPHIAYYDADNADLDGIEYEANCVKVTDIHNLIEQKFEELLMLVEMQLVMNSRNTKKHKKLSKK